MARLLARALLFFLVVPCVASREAPAAVLAKENFVIWGSGGSMPGSLLDPRGIAVSPYGDRIFIADTGNDRVQVFTSSFGFLWQWGGHGSGKGTFDGPVGISTDAEGYVYVADSGNGLVQKFTEVGAFLTQWSVPGVIGVAADRSGHVYGLSGFFNLVSRRTSNGKEAGGWQAVPWDVAPPGGMAQSNVVRGIATDAVGNVYVSGIHTRHYGYDCSGDAPGPDELSARVWKLSPTGTELGMFFLEPYPSDCYHGIRFAADIGGVAVDLGDGAVYASIPIAVEVRYGGASLTSFVRLNRPPYPSLTDVVITSIDGVAVDCRGNLWTTSRTAERVIEYVNAAPPPGGCPKRPLLKAASLGDIVVDQNGALVTVRCAAGKCKGTVQLLPVFDCPLCGTRPLRFQVPGPGSSAVRVPLSERLRGLIESRGQVPVRAVLRMRRKRIRGPIDVLRSPAALTLACPSGATAGGAVEVSGSLTPAHETSLVRVVATPPLGTSHVEQASSDGGGGFRVAVTGLRAGTWTFAANWPGDVDHEPAHAEACTVAVSKRPSTIALDCPARVPYGEPFPIAGLLAPAVSAASVRIVYTSPDSVEQVTPVSTDDTGAFSDGQITPGGQGPWTVGASWAGDDDHEAATATPCEIIVG